MKLTCLETGRWTRIKRGTDGFCCDVEAAADRLIKRTWPGWWASINPPLDERDDSYEFTAERVSAAGDLTEHSGEFLTFRVSV